MNGKIDINISGATHLQGGEYHNVRLSGSGKIDGDLRANSLRCSGAVKVEGNAEVGELVCSGACKIEGNVQARTADVSGSCKIGGGFRGGELHISGGVKVKDQIHCQKLDLAGLLKTEQGLEAEVLSIHGCIGVETLLNADTILLESNDVSKVREIGCSSLTVQRKAGVSGFLQNLFGPKNKYILECETIEADKATLEATKAHMVRGRDLTIGPGCHIDRVEYSGTCKAEEGTVGKLVQV